ncbi:MAG TPA: helix-turn-helix transcriptional regulator [Crinalium sp.]|jgi:hypothetical protein
MAAELTKIQSYVPQILLDKLIEYQQTHKLQSTSQAIAAALSEFFGIEFIRSSSISTNNPTIFHRVEQVETSVNCLVQRVSALEQNYVVLSQLIECDAVKLSTEALQLLEPGSSTSSTLVQEKNISLSSLDIDTAHQGNTSSLSQNSATSNYLDREPVILSPEEWATGLTTNTLVARLKTNPSTLKKYLRDLKQVQWAVERDPQQLGWTYDSSLQRYYPVQVDLIQNAPQTPASSVLETGEQQQSNINGETKKLICMLENNTQPQHKAGLSQSQLSRLTGISTNTLQRWKQLPECAELIRCRTEGMFSYWYSSQYKLFYPLDFTER